MSITDELRMYVQDWRDTPSLMDGLDRGDVDGILEDFIRIADRIDAAHAKAVERARMDGMDATFGNGWVKLPVDADGVPIRVGDELTNGEDLPSAVCCMLLRDGGWTVASKALFGFGIRPSTLRHVKHDSWERIIADTANFALDTQHTAGRISLEPFVERCRRLAGEGA